MQVACSKCKTRYDIPAEKLGDSILKVRCAKCGHVFGVRKKRAEAPPLPAEPELRLEVQSENPEADIPPEREQPPEPQPEEPSEPSEAPGPEEIPEAEESREPLPPETEPPITPEEEEKEAESDLSFGDFNLDDLAGAPPPEAREAEISEADLAALDLDFSASGSDEEDEKEEPAEEPLGEGDFNLDEFSLTGSGPDAVEPPAEAKAAPEEPEARRDGSAEDPDLSDLDLSDFTSGEDQPPPDWGKPQESAPPRAPREEEEREISAEDFAKGLQELDLAAFDEKEEEEPAIERVTSADLIAGGASGKKSKPEKIPKPKKPSRPLPWGLIGLVTLLSGAVGFLAYNIMAKPGSAFVLVNPSAIKYIMNRGDVDKVLALVAPQEGGYLERDDKKRIYVVTGAIKNMTQTPVSNLRVRANLFSDTGEIMTSREAFCGNVLGKEELLGLPLEKVMAAGELQVGAAFANVDIPPGSKVAYMVVFPDPPPKVAKYSVDVIPPLAAEKKTK